MVTFINLSEFYFVMLYENFNVYEELVDELSVNPDSPLSINKIESTLEEISTLRSMIKMDNATFDKPVLTTLNLLDMKYGAMLSVVYNLETIQNSKEYVGLFMEIQGNTFQNSQGPILESALEELSTLSSMIKEDKTLNKAESTHRLLVHTVSTKLLGDIDNLTNSLADRI